MGIYDREYYREEPQGFTLGGARMMVTNLVIINIVLYLVDMIFFQKTHELMRGMALEADLFQRPWNVWQLVTYGFAHNWANLWHIIGNMFCLWFFGRDVEGIYGKKAFLQFYLSTIVLVGAISLVTEPLFSRQFDILLGASGGVAGVILLYILHFPKRTLLLYFVLPIPAWALGVIFLLSDFAGTFNSDSHVAHSAHLAGMALGYVFYKTGFQLGRLIPKKFSLSSLKSRPKFCIHDPGAGDDLSAEVDRILAKISREGESSLTARERRTLEDASRKYQQKNR